MAADFFSQKISPMLATLGSMPLHPKEYAFEFKWDGYRAICLWDGKAAQFRTRNNLDITKECRFLGSSGLGLGRHPVILDGELIALDPKGRVSFLLLQEQFGFRRKAAGEPARLAYIVFDLLYLK